MSTFKSVLLPSYQSLDFSASRRLAARAQALDDLLADSATANLKGRLHAANELTDASQRQIPDSLAPKGSRLGNARSSALRYSSFRIFWCLRSSGTKSGVPRPGAVPA